MRDARMGNFPEMLVEKYLCRSRRHSKRRDERREKDRRLEFTS